MKKNDLHELVHSMTKSEKRHFRLQSLRQSGEVNYLILFDILEKQHYFDEKELKNALPEQSKAKQLHVTKNYLREKILESLRQFHNKISRDAMVKDHLKNVEILFYKELYSQASDELARAEKIAREFELYPALIELARWNRKLEQTLRPNAYQRVSEILVWQNSYLDALANHRDHLEAILHTTLNFMGNRRNQGGGAMPGELAPAVGLESKVLNYNRLYIIYLREQRHAEAEATLLELLNLLEAHPARVQEDPSSYLTTAGNLAGYYIFQKDGTATLELLRRCRRFMQQSGIPDRRRPVLKQMMRLLNMELEIYRNAENTADYEAFLQETGEYVAQSGPKLPVEYMVSFHFQFAWVYFLQGRYKTALDWLSAPLNEPRKYEGQPAYRYLLLLNLMVHFEQKNVFVLRYFVDSARRQLKKTGEIQSWEQELLQFFSKAGQLPEGEWKYLKKALAARLYPENGSILVPGDALRMLDLGRWLNISIVNAK